MDDACMDCKINLDELKEFWYCVESKLWSQIIGRNVAGLICIGCFEKRLGRKLCCTDFNWRVLINSLEYVGVERLRSDRLRDRMEGQHEQEKFSRHQSRS